MRTIILTIAAVFSLAAINAQSPVRVRMVATTTVNPGAEPLYIIDDSIASKESLISLNPEHIASIDIIKDSTSVAYYGARARNGVVIIRTKQPHQPPYLNFDNLLDQYNITGENRKLKVCVDDIEVRNKYRIALDPSEIVRVEIANSTCWRSPVEAGPEETHINIVTKKSLIRDANNY